MHYEGEKRGKGGHQLKREDRCKLARKTSPSTESTAEKRFYTEGQKETFFIKKLAEMPQI